MPLIKFLQFWDKKEVCLFPKYPLSYGSYRFNCMEKILSATGKLKIKVIPLAKLITRE